MAEGAWESDQAADLAKVGEAFVLAWSSMPADLPEKISTSQLRALVAIRRGDGATVTDLARALDALPSSATRLCDRLAAAGYIDRTANPANRRFHSLSLTRQGVELLRTLDRHRERVLATVLAGMPAPARAHLAEGLAAFAVRSSAAAPLTAPPVPPTPRITSAEHAPDLRTG